MKIVKLAAALAVGVLFTSAAFAQFDDDFGSWDDDFSSSSFDDDDSFGSFDDDDSFGSFGDDDDSFGSFGSFGGDDSSSSSAITFSGDLSLDARYYFAKDESKYFLDGTRSTTGARIFDRDSEGERIHFYDTALKAIPKAKIGISYSGSMSEASLTANLTEQTLKDYHEDIIDELIIRGYFLNNALTIEGGKMKIVWGKGDKLHVLDNFNADDYTDFIVPDYIDRRISTPMLRFVYSQPTASALTIEGVFTPFLPKDRFAKKDSLWIPSAYNRLQSSVKTIIAAQVALMPALAPKALQFDADDMEPDVYSLKYSQAGLHLTGTAGSFDWGVSYYYGHYKQPSANAEDAVLVLNQAAVMASRNPELIKKLQKAGQRTAAGEFLVPKLEYDRKQTFGIEAATVLGRFNLRAEAAYNLTDDVAGDDPWVHNNSFGWLIGFDMDLPISNINVNVQETGTYILKNNNLADGIFKEYDIDYDPKGRYTNDKLVVNITDSWMHDRLKPEVTIMWGIERGDWVIQPKVAYSPTPELTLSLSGMYIYCRDEYSEFYEWKNNDFVNVGIRYQF